MNITASSIERAAHCPASHAFPAVRSSNVYSLAGDARHSFANMVSDGVSREDALSAMPEEFREQCADLPIDNMSLHLASEVAFAFNVVTGEAREIGRNVNRQYNAAPSEICGTVDIVGVGDDCVLIKDFKGPHADLTHPKDNHQMLFGALCAARVYKKNTAILTLSRLVDDRTKDWTATVDAWTLDTFALSLAKIKTRVDWEKKNVSQGKVPDVNAGKWCRYCPAFDSCPAKVGLLKAMLDDTETTRIESMMPLPASLAPHVYRQWREMGTLYKRVTAIIHAYASRNTIDLGDGKAYGPVTTTTEKIDGDVAYTFVQNTFGQLMADEVTKRTMTKASLKVLARDMKIAGEVSTLKEGEESLLSALRKLDGLKEKETTKIVEFRTKELPSC